MSPGTRVVCTGSQELTTSNPEVVVRPLWTSGTVILLLGPSPSEPLRTHRLSHDRGPDRLTVCGRPGKVVGVLSPADRLVGTQSLGSRSLEVAELREMSECQVVGVLGCCRDPRRRPSSRHSCVSRCLRRTRASSGGRRVQWGTHLLSYLPADACDVCAGSLDERTRTVLGVSDGILKGALPRFTINSKLFNVNTKSFL